jgi:hypothetical protein
LQHRVLHPATSAEGSNAFALHMLLHEVKSLLQTRTLWLPALQADCVGRSDWVEGCWAEKG